MSKIRLIDKSVNFTAQMLEVTIYKKRLKTVGGRQQREHKLGIMLFIRT